MRKIPAGYCEIKNGNTCIILAEKYTGSELGQKIKGLSIIERPKPPLPWGRGKAALVKGDDNGDLVVRQYLHGGITGSLFRSLYIGSARPVGELRATLEAAGANVPVPEIIAVIIKAYGILSKCWIVSREVRGAENMAQYLAKRKSTEGRISKRIIRETAETVRKLHEAGINHRDLNAGNILVREGKNPGIFIIDFDRAGTGIEKMHRLANSLSRLNRSIVKSCGDCISVKDRLGFLRVYFNKSGLDREFIKRCERSLKIHRFFWRLPGS